MGAEARKTLLGMFKMMSDADIALVARRAAEAGMMFDAAVTEFFKNKIANRLKGTNTYDLHLGVGDFLPGYGQIINIEIQSSANCQELVSKSGWITRREGLPKRITIITCVGGQE